MRHRPPHLRFRIPRHYYVAYFASADAPETRDVSGDRLPAGFHGARARQAVDAILFEEKTPVGRQKVSLPPRNAHRRVDAEAPPAIGLPGPRLLRAPARRVI